jgi:hypothetical protein
MIAPLKADAQGASEVIIYEPTADFTIGRGEWVAATKDGLSRVWHHLRSVRSMPTPQADGATFPDSIAAAFASSFTTPCHFWVAPGFTAPRLACAPTSRHS